MGQQTIPVYYAPPLPRSNGLGIAGFIVSLLGLLSCGLLAPVGLLLSFIALFKRPRGFAVAGFIIGLIGCIWGIIALVLGFFGLVLGAAGIAKAAPYIQTEIRMAHVADVVASHKNADGTIPTDLAAIPELSSRDRKDTWGRPLHIVAKSAGEFEVISDGPDRIAGTSDDLTSSTWTEADRPRVKKRHRRMNVD